MKLMHKRVKGFTLIELLVVIVIIATLAALLMPALSRAREQAKYVRWLHLRRSNQMDVKCVGYWSFEEGSGTTIKNQALAGGGLYGKSERLDGTFPAAPANRPTWVPANDPGGRNRFLSKPSLSFDGNDFVRVPHSESINSSTNITITAWVRSTRNGAWQLIGKNDRWFATGARGWHISTAVNPADLVFEIQDGTRRWWIGFRTGRVFDWTFITAVREGNVIRTYTNGILQGTRTVSGTMENSFDLFIGSFTGTSRWFGGTIDEVAIFNVALTREEIERRFRMGRGR